MATPPVAPWSELVGHGKPGTLLPETALRRARGSCESRAGVVLIPWNAAAGAGVRVQAEQRAGQAGTCPAWGYRAVRAWAAPRIVWLGPPGQMGPLGMTGRSRLSSEPSREGRAGSVSLGWSAQTDVRWMQIPLEHWGFLEPPRLGLGCGLSSGRRGVGVLSTKI